MPEKKRKTKPSKYHIIFVCTGNTCRSAMAEYLFKYLLKKLRKLSLYTVRSAGIAANEGEEISAHAKEALKQMGITNIKHKATQLNVKMLENADMVVCMTARHLEAVQRYTTKAVTVASITGTKDVADPYGLDIGAYMLVAETLKYMCEELLQLLNKKNDDTTQI